MRLILLAFFMCFSVFSFSQGIKFSGTVIDENSLEPIHGAKVSTSGNMHKSDDVTDKDGYFTLELLEKIKIGQLVRIRVSKSGYKLYDNNETVGILKQLKIFLERVEAPKPEHRKVLHKTPVLSPTVVWSYETLLQGIKDKNYTITEAFFKGGMKLKASDLIDFYNTNFDPVIASQIVEHAGFKCSDCLGIFDKFYYQFFNNSEKAKSIKKLCNCKIDKGSLDAIIVEEKLKIDHFRQLINDSERECLADLSPNGEYNIFKLYGQYLDEAAHDVILNHMTISSPKEKIVSELNILLLGDSDSVNPNSLKKLFEKYCPQFYYRVQADPATLKLLYRLKEFWGI